MQAKGYLMSFVAAFLICALLFLLLDMAVMNLQGLNLIFQQ
ncbi:MAG: hypothetical protein ACE5H8_01020 [Alphaproteobacteria bacterium]